MRLREWEFAAMCVFCLFGLVDIATWSIVALIVVIVAGVILAVLVTNVPRWRDERVAKEIRRNQARRHP